MPRTLECTYTRDVRKKRRVWSDGIATVSDDERQIKLVNAETKKVEHSGFVDPKLIGAVLEGEEALLTPSIMILLGEPIVAVVAAPRQQQNEPPSTAPALSKLQQLQQRPAGKSVALQSLLNRPSAAATAAAAAFSPSSSSSSSLGGGGGVSLPERYLDALCRRTTLPPSFFDTRKYCHDFFLTVSEEVSLALGLACKSAEDDTKRALSIPLFSSSSTTSTTAPPAAPAAAAAAAGSKAKARRLSAEEVLAAMRFKGLPLSVHVGLVVKTPYVAPSHGKGGAAGKGKRKLVVTDDDEEDSGGGGAEEPAGQTEYFLSFPVKDKDCPKSCEAYKRDDLWVIWLPDDPAREASVVAAQDGLLPLDKVKALRGEFLRAKADAGYPLPFFGGVLFFRCLIITSISLLFLYCS